MTTLFPGRAGHVNPNRIGVCRYCGAVGPVTLDHVVPRSVARVLRLERGIDLPSIKVDACSPCNRAKGSMMPWEWWEYRGTLAAMEAAGGGAIRKRAFLAALPPRPGLGRTSRDGGLSSGRCGGCGAKLSRGEHFSACPSPAWAAQTAAFNGV